MAKKDPAFLFYPKDWIQGTAKMMPEEKGVYIDLLAHQHQDKDLPNDTKRLSRIVGLSESDFLPIWDTIKDKFIPNNNNRLVNRKLTELMTERLELSKKNKIIGTMASVFRLTDAPYDLKFECKKNFNYQDFWDVKETELTEKVTEWFSNRLAGRLKSIGNGNAIGNGDISNSIGNRLWFLKFYHSTYENYKMVFNGQSCSKEFFDLWKRFIDMIYEKKYEDVFECKFVSPHDFAKLVEKNSFTEDVWEATIKSLLSTGIKPEHNLFFRIPTFMKFSKTGETSVGGREKSEFELEVERKRNKYKGLKES